MRRFRLLVTISALLLLAPVTGVIQPSHAQERVITYSTRTIGDVDADFAHFRSVVAATYAHERGWNLGGSVGFREVSQGGDFTVWLASPEEVDEFHPICSQEFSCRVGNDVVINDEAWREATPAWPRSLAEYRHMVVNHETGHWLGLDHRTCPGNQQIAPLMMQQSKGLDGCIANAWPTDEERQRVADILNVPILFPETVSFAPHEDDGYWILEQDGEVLFFGGVTDFGDLPPVASFVDITATPTGEGYWGLDRAGGVFTAGNARFHGSIPGLQAAGQDIGEAREMAIAATPSGGGYWVLDDLGGVFTFGDAGFHGSIPGLRAAGQEIGEAREVSMAPTPSGNGYWVLDDLGGVFTFGDAGFHGSIPGLRAAGQEIPLVPVVDIGATPSGNGYWLLDAHGGVFTFGDAGFHGSVPGSGAEITTAAEFAATPSGNGYWIVDDRGRVVAFGDAPFHGSGV